MRSFAISMSALVPVAVILMGVEAAQGQHMIYKPDAIEWKAGPPALPTDVKMAVLRGDTAQPGLFTMRLKFPGKFQVSVHWHPADEHVTVISGSLHIGLGEKFDAAKTTPLNPGTIMVMPATTRHFMWFEQETVLQFHGIGPWQINYVNPADDPRKK